MGKFVWVFLRGIVMTKLQRIQRRKAQSQIESLCFAIERLELYAQNSPCDYFQGSFERLYGELRKLSRLNPKAMVWAKKRLATVPFWD